MRRRFLVTAIAAVAAVTIASACEPEPTPLEFFDPLIHVHGMLVAGSETASVFMIRPAPGQVFDYRLRAVPVHDAMVTLAAEGHSTILHEDTAEVTRCARPGPSVVDPLLDGNGGCYVARIDGGVKAGMNYDLSITLPDGSSVRGRTTVPNVPNIIAPTSGAELDVTRTQRPLTVTWSSATTPHAPDVHVWSAPECSVPVEVASITNDGDGGSVTVRSRFPSFGCNPNDSRQDAHLRLSLYDSAYAGYKKELARSENSIRLSRASFGLVGALGIFGSTAHATLPITLRR